MSDISHLHWVEIEIRGVSYGARRVTHVPRVGEKISVDLVHGVVQSVETRWHDWRDRPNPTEYVRVVAS